MKQLPILFSTPMVQAILKGTKTETRRATGKIKIINENPDNWNLNHFTSDRSHLIAVFFNKAADTYLQVKSPYGFAGDVLWVRETHKFLGEDFEGDIIIKYKDGGVISVTPEMDREDYWNDRLEKLLDVMAKKDKVVADEENEMFTWKAKDIPWTLSIHMPKDAARIWLKITNVTVERLLDITKEAAKSEGVESEFDDFFADDRYTDYLNNSKRVYALPETSFLSLWQSINGQESQYKNPWVWVIQFERIEKPEICYKSNQPCIHNCEGLCKESC